jgi:hypothetical protein
LLQALIAARESPSVNGRFAFTTSLRCPFSSIAHAMSEIADDKMLQIRSPLHICPNGELLIPAAALFSADFDQTPHSWQTPHPPPVAFVIYYCILANGFLMAAVATLISHRTFL